jgi:hypothetical protein
MGKPAGNADPENLFFYADAGLSELVCNHRSHGALTGAAASGALRLVLHVLKRMRPAAHSTANLSLRNGTADADLARPHHCVEIRRGLHASS